MIKCLLSFEPSHYILYLKPSSTNYLTIYEFQESLVSQYSNLIKNLNLDFEKDEFEIYDLDFEQYVIVDKFTQIKNLSKLKVKKSTNAINLNNECFKNLIFRNAGDQSENEDEEKNDKNKSKNHGYKESNDGNKEKNDELESSLNNNNFKMIRTSVDGSNNLIKQQSNNNIDSRSENESSKLVNKFTSQATSGSSMNGRCTFKTAQCQTVETDHRIIHLKDNLFKQRCLQIKSEYIRLIEENKRLNAKIELYKQGSVANATNYLDDFVFNADQIERLNKELNEAKEEQKTIMEGFKKKSKEFRRVVYLLTGFKFDALEQRKYRVSHIYSDPNDYLFFTFEKDEVINLLGNKYSEKFFDLIKTYLVEHGSYPTFLAGITIKLFKEKQENLKKEP